ncbi:DMT family transporter [Ponticoccus sp. SC2-23]|uniref:DMT family transporter n=1 Tax=Alexandriicola marinus TaxID=2081710 RepID=UPI000FDADF86|nr:DMT family transporter [Alexandriicola marinus]MBM1221894.1 DMT family transporter [Ponticoccus sp. SC6-9]MBM1226245.1 DMT family transporter [Ponticoccus sp. SC6-15]MBM1230841.1 DMT family transporter [Ponticoccus sp. SC6-38]MBM1235318.1 DMT family transporter [Ponticoccus sp. SC6-45]MBM1239863.1 DMT family transporter [Ponticoccus sp. SC6-49]MBM1244007.1 DMT family transporter [Ponticoccus sp. SC2-64]MBM1248842.1 DMT family transporter [Ponticoccus sp. SC6-42]MBM1253518.1 DMT family tr
MTRNDSRLGIVFMIATTLVFAAQDGLSRHLAGEYNVLMIVMIRYWFFAAFVIAVAVRKSGSLRAAARTTQPVLQASRGLLLAAEICVMVLAFVLIGLVESHAMFACYPLLIAALSGPVLGEKVGWRRWAAIGMGFVGVLIILQPGVGVFSPYSLVALLSATMFALYGLLTRFAARKDTVATSFFWTGTVGAILMTVIGIWFWEPMTGPDWALMAVLCVTGASGHWLLIKTYEVAEASAVQPFAYLQLVFASLVGITVFNEVLEPNVAIGSAIVVGAGLFTLLRERKVKQAS